MSRDILITPNRGSTGPSNYPTIDFGGLSSSSISLKVDNDGSIVYTGTYGALFNVTDNKDGLLHSVNDVSGLPILSVYSYDYVQMGKWDKDTLIVNSDKVGVGLTAPSTKFHIYSTQSGAFRLQDGTEGDNYILVSDVNGVASWTSSMPGTSGNKTFSGDILIQGTLSVLNSFTAGSIFEVNTNSNFNGDLLPTIDSVYNLGSSSLQWNKLYVASQSLYVGGVTISSNNDAISIHKLNLGTEVNPTLLTASGSDIYVNGNIFSAGDTKTLIVAKDGTEFTSVKTAVDSITDASSTNIYTVRVSSGVYYEEPFTIPSFVAVIGQSSISTIIQATFSNQTLITLSDQSAIFDVQIQGCTDTGVSAVVYSSPTTPQTNAISYVENVRFGTNYTHARVVGTASGNCIMQCSNIKYGGYPFTIGFEATNYGSGVGRMQLRNVTSTNGGVTNTTSIFAKAGADTSIGNTFSCGFIVNGCLLTRSTGAAAGIGFQVQNGGFLRLTGVNFQRWSKAIYAPDDTGTPSIDAISLNFENNTVDVQIDNTKATGKIQGTDNYSKTLISSTASLYVVNKDQRIITVAKKGGDFTSVGSAVNSITDSSDTNRYTVEVGPGVFYENQIDLSTRPYVSIVGSNIQTTQIFASASSQHLFKMGIANEISFLSLNNVGNGYAAIFADDSGDFSQVHKFSFYDCHTGIKVSSSTQDTIFFGEYVDFNGSYSIAVDVQSSNGIRSFANIENFYCYPGVTGSYGSFVSGTSSELDVAVASFVGLGNDYAFYIENGPLVNIKSTDINGFETGIYVKNAGTFSTFDAGNITMGDDVLVPINAEHPQTKGFFQGSLYDHSLIISNSADVYWNFLDRLDGELNITRKTSITYADGTTTDLSTLVFETSPMGVIEGGIISLSSGLTVSVSGGYGYLEITTGEIHKRIDWSTSLYEFSDNVSEYLYINENETLVSSVGLPSIENNILLGRVVTFNGDILFIDNSRVQTKHAFNKLNLFNRKALGSIYETGSIVSAATFSLDVTSGSYWYGDKNFTPTGGSSITFHTFYRDGSGGWLISSTNSVTSDYDNNSGSLITMSASYYTKHTLYVVGEGVDENYLLVIGQNQYSSLVSAEDAPLPTPPSYFEDGVTPISSVYVQQGTSSIYQVEDIRPVIGFKSSGVNATSDHGNLLGLSDDDHQQYLLVTGARSLTGNLIMGSNSIIGVLQVNGVTVESHSSRHLPNGSDPLATGVPSTIGTSNSEGIANVFARQDHIHAHGNQPGGTLHATASTTVNGFMSSVDKTIFDEIPQTYVNVTGDNINGNLGVSGSNISFTFSSFNLTDSGSGSGAIYDIDYSSTFVDNSLISKKYVDDRLRKTSTVITTDGSTVTVATVSVPLEYTTIYEVYVSATSSNSIWGAWKREVVLTNFGGVANVVFVNSQLDKQLGLIPTNLSFTCSSGDLLVNVTGTTSQTVNWITKYEKII